MTARDLLALWEVADGTLVRQSQNEVYLCHRDGQAIYVRLTFDDHRSVAEIEAEMDWMRHLVAHGISIVTPLASARGAYVETARVGDRKAFAVATVAAPGRAARKPADFTPAAVSAWAHLLADLHSNARTYTPREGSRRATWDGDRVLMLALAANDEPTRLAQQRLHTLVAWMKSLPRTRETFGICHADLHLGNMNIVERGGEVGAVAFDFDDACEHFYAHDLAVAVTSIRKAAWESPGLFDAAALVDVFLSSYANAAHATIVPAELERFVAYRIALSTCWAARCHSLGELDAEMTAWYERSLPWWLEQISRTL